jgi:hypothetical protein
MAMRTARSGGMTARWAYGVFIALCAALGVLVHHETVALGTSSATGAVPMSAMDHSTMPSAVYAGHVMPGEGAQGAAAARKPSSPDSTDPGGCAAPGMQHCTTASVDSVQLAVPDETGSSVPADLREAPDGRTPAGAVGRAPPDLSVLSQLRI